MSALTNLERGHALLVEFVNILQELGHEPLSDHLRRALRAGSAAEAERVLDGAQDLLRDLRCTALANALTPIILAYAGPNPNAGGAA